MGAERTLLLKLLGDTSSIDKSLKGTEKRFAELKKWTKAAALDLVITGVEDVTNALGDAWSGFREGQKLADQLGLTWKNLGLDGTKLDGTLQAIYDSTLALGTSDDEAVQAFNNVLKATGDQAEAMKRLRIAQDLVASGSAPNLESAMTIIRQAAKGSARAVDKFGLTAQTAGGRVKELGNKVKGAAKNKAALDPLGVLFNRINEDLEGIVGSLSSGDIQGAMASLGQIGTDLNTAWSNVYGPISKVLDLLSGGKKLNQLGQVESSGGFSDFAASVGGLIDRFSELANTILPKVQGAFDALSQTWDALAPSVQTALDAIQPLIDLISTSVSGGLGFVLDSVTGVLQAFAALLRGDFSGAFTAVSDTVGKLGADINNFFVGIPSTIANALPGIVAAAGSIGQGILNGVLDNVALLGTYITGAFNGVVTMLQNAIGNVNSAASGIGKAIFDGVVGWVRSMINTVVDAWNRLDFSIPPGSFQFTPEQNIPNPFGGFFHIPSVGFNWSGSGDLVPDIPKLAKGGIVSSPTLAMIGEGASPEAVVPLDGRHGLGGNTYNIQVIVAPGGDLVEAGRQMVRAIQQYERRSGKVWRSA